MKSTTPILKSTASTGFAPSANRHWKTILAVAALLLITLAVYYPLRLAGYIWDDALWVTNNPIVHHWRGFEIFWLHPDAMPQYYPMTISFLSVEYHLWGLDKLPYHLVNVLFQAVNAILLWLVLRRLELKSAWLIAAIFAIHPVQVETVAWVAEMKNLLSGLFYFLALLSFLAFAGIGPAYKTAGKLTSPKKPYANHQLYVVSTLLFLCGLLSKTDVCTLPVAIVIILWWKKSLRDKEIILHLIPWFIIAFIIGLVTIHVEHTSTGAHGPDWHFSMAQRFLIAGHAFWFYLINLVWPHPLLMIYPRWHLEHLGNAIGYIWLIAAVVFFAFLWLLKDRIGRGPMAAMLFYLIAIGPVLGFITFYTQLFSFVADHYQYIACIGPMALVGELIYWGAARIAPWKAAIEIAASAIILIVLGWVAFNQSRLYESDYQLWHYVYLHNPDSFMVKALYGSTLLERGEYDSAMTQLIAANTMHRHVVTVVFNLAAGYMLTHHYHRALHYYGWYLMRVPGSVDAWTDAANCLIGLDAFEPAAKDLAMACKLKPNFAMGWMELAYVSYLAGHRRYAEEFRQRAVALDPTMAGINLAHAPKLLQQLRSRNTLRIRVGSGQETKAGHK